MAAAAIGGTAAYGDRAAVTAIAIAVLDLVQNRAGIRGIVDAVAANCGGRSAHAGQANANREQSRQNNHFHRRSLQIALNRCADRIDPAAVGAYFAVSIADSRLTVEPAATFVTGYIYGRYQRR
jgi:hypothetical protein